MSTKKERKETKRGAYRRSNCVFLGAWVPTDWVQALDQMVVDEDSDRSKLIRRAIQEKLQPVGAK